MNGREFSHSSSFASDGDTSDHESPSPGKLSDAKRRRKRFGDLLRGSDGARDSHLRYLVSRRRPLSKYLGKKLLKRRETSNQDVTTGQIPKAMSFSDLFSLIKKEEEPEVKESRGRGTRKYFESRSSDISDTNVIPEEILTEEEIENMEIVSEALKVVIQSMEEYQELAFTFPIEVRMDKLTYSAPLTLNSNKIQTVYNSSLLYKVVKYFKDIGREKVAAEKGTKTILDNISLILKPGKMYLVLGPPGSGKSSLLKAIAGRLSTKNGEQISGTVSYNGRTFKDKTSLQIENAIAFVDQLDRHEPTLTVEEVFEFAFQCKRGGTHFDISNTSEKNKISKLTEKADAERLLVNTTLLSLGLDHVRDTFVGDDVVRGVSGGQRRRVTLGEMMMNGSPILCGDEISNGLDASSTFEIVQLLMLLSKYEKKTSMISLLQPSPETVSLFDDVILLAEGKCLYAGPIRLVEDYFAALGYKAPRHMDVADFLQLLSTSDAEKLFEPTGERHSPHTAAELAELFRESTLGERILQELETPLMQVWSSVRHDINHYDKVNHVDDSRFQKRYANSFPRSVFLNLRRNIRVWTRNKRVLIANAVKNIIMGVSVGGVFFQTDDVVSILGVLFQGMLFIMLGK